MLSVLKEQLEDSIRVSLQEDLKSLQDQPAVELEIPRDKNHGEFSSNIALKLAKSFKKSPMQIAEEFKVKIFNDILRMPLNQKIDKVEVKKPGFINFYLSKNALYDILCQVFASQEKYGQLTLGAGQKVQIEFVSANPTGPLSVAHARQAAVGDALGNVLKFVGYDVCKEYYVNDEGNQINLLGESVRMRAISELKKEPLTPEEAEALPYKGEYIIDIAKAFMEKYAIKNEEALNAHKDKLSQYAVHYLMSIIKEELDDFGVHFDVWSHQSELASEAQTKEMVENLKNKGFVYEKEGALWFKSTDYGDDKDRVVRKSDGSHTYLAPDIVYHNNKFERGFDKVLNIWGPDHHGYISRLKAAVNALGYDPEHLIVLIVQLATIYRDGNPISMSTRRGQYISLREVMQEVGVDASRFFFLMRHINAHLDFDLELAKKETPENPVYYIQYAHARINSIIAKAKETDCYAKTDNFELLGEEEELILIKKIGSFPDILAICAGEMDVFALVNYLLELAACFHKFYDLCRVIDPENPALSCERLALIDATRIVLANGLRLAGVSAPRRM